MYRRSVFLGWEYAELQARNAHSNAAYSVFSTSNLVTLPSGWNADRQIYRYMIFCDEADFAFDEVNRTCNWHVWSEANSHFKAKAKIQYGFSVNAYGDVSKQSADWPIYLPGFSYRRRLSTSSTEWTDTNVVGNLRLDGRLRLHV